MLEIRFRPRHMDWRIALLSSREITFKGIPVSCSGYLALRTLSGPRVAKPRHDANPHFAGYAADGKPGLMCRLGLALKQTD